MGRGVSYPQGAEVLFADFDEDDDGRDFCDMLDNLKGVAQYRYPSLDSCDKWIGREDRAVLKNRLVYVGVSEYCGRVAVWVVPRDDAPQALAERFARQVNIKDLVACFGKPLQRAGYFLVPA